MKSALNRVRRFFWGYSFLISGFGLCLIGGSVLFYHSLLDTYQVFAQWATASGFGLIFASSLASSISSLIQRRRFEVQRKLIEKRGGAKLVERLLRDEACSLVPHTGDSWAYGWFSSVAEIFHRIGYPVDDRLCAHLPKPE